MKQILILKEYVNPVRYNKRVSKNIATYLDDFGSIRKGQRMESIRPGRELDALIASKIMKLDGEPRPYSTDHDAAWELIAEIDKEHDLLREMFYILYDGFNLKEVKPGDVMEHVRLVPFLICKSALEAYEFTLAFPLRMRR